MTTFADRMLSFTENLQASIRDRGESLCRVHRSTGDLREAARGFMADMARDHQAMSEDLRHRLATQRAEQQERVEAMRNRHRDSLRTMRDELRQVLDNTNEARHDAVQQMREGFQEAHAALSSDLRGAAEAWQNFVATRGGAAAHEAPATDKPEKTQGKRSAPSKRGGSQARRRGSHEHGL